VVVVAHCTAGIDEGYAPSIKLCGKVDDTHTGYD
jgi:hypothetical protein